MWVVLPVVAVVAICALWLGPERTGSATGMMQEANRNLLITGLEPGRFTALPNNGGMVYVGAMSADGRRFSRMFVHRVEGDRIDVTTSNTGGAVPRRGRLALPAPGRRFPRGRPGRRRPRLPPDALRAQRTAPARHRGRSGATTIRIMLSTLDLLGDPRPRPPRSCIGGSRRRCSRSRSRCSPCRSRAARRAQPLRARTARLPRLPGRHEPDGARHALDFEGRVPASLGLWWLVLPLLGFATWLYLRDGRMRRVRTAPGAAA